MLHPVDGKLVVDATDDRLTSRKQYQGLDYLDGVKQVVAALSIEQKAEGHNSRDGLPGLTRGLYGYFGYGVAGMFERKLRDVCRPEDAEACLVLPGQMVLFDHLRHSCCYLSLDEGATPMPAPIQWGADLTAPEAGTPKVHPGKDEYTAGVERCKELHRRGRVHPGGPVHPVHRARAGRAVQDLPPVAPGQPLPVHVLHEIPGLPVHGARPAAPPCSAPRPR